MNDVLDQSLRTLLQERLDESHSEYSVAEKRSLRETSRPPQARYRRSTSQRVRLSAVLVCASVLTVSGVAVASGLNVIHIPSLKHDLSQNVPALRAEDAEQLSDADYARISSGVRTLTSMSPQDPDPGLRASETMHIDRGVVLLDDPADGRIVAVSSDKGDVCLNYLYEDRDMGTACASEMTPTGVIYTQLVAGRRQQLYGLAASDVTSITITGSDGRTYAASLQNNAFAWASKPNVSPSTVTVERAGVSHTYTMATLTGVT